MASTESLNELTKDQLFQLAEDNNVEVKKSATKTELVEAVQGSVTQEDVDALTSGDEGSDSSDQSKAEARPIGEGKDPLAEGNTLVNPSNTEAETHYEVKERSEDVAAQDTQNTIDGQDANQRAEQHNASDAAPVTSNSDSAEQNEVADGRTEPGGDVVDDTPDVVDVPELSDEEQAANADDRQAAMEKDIEKEA